MDEGKTRGRVGLPLGGGIRDKVECRAVRYLYLSAAYMGLGLVVCYSLDYSAKSSKTKQNKTKKSNESRNGAAPGVGVDPDKPRHRRDQ